MFMWLDGLEALTLNHYIATYGDFRFCGSGDIVFVICHVILEDHVTKKSCDLMSTKPLR